LVIYTLWLKRRSPWSIVLGGIAGGMPILAGRVLATGYVDWIGLLLALSVLLWIPTHIMTLAMNHSDDYRLAGIPVFPNVFGFRSARFFIAGSNVAASLAVLSAFLLLHVSPGGIAMASFACLCLLAFSARMIIYPSRKSNFAMFKLASLYMLGVMLVLIV